MTDLPRYEELFDHDLLPHPDGPWVKWGDVSARLQQLEAEKARLEHQLKEALTCVYEICGCGTADDGHCMSCCLPLTNHRIIAKGEIEEIERRLLCYHDSRKSTEAALAETRDALHQVIAKYRAEASDCLAQASRHAQGSDEWRRWMDFTGMAHRHANELAAVAPVKDQAP